MNIIKLSTLALLLSASLYSTEPEISPLPETTEIAAKEMEIPGLDLKAIKSGELAVQPESIANLFGKDEVSSSYFSPFGFYPSSYALAPYAQELVYLDGDLCHMGYYADLTVVTTLSGYSYGYQVILSPYGQVLSTQDFYYIDSTIYGSYLRHEYLDVTIVTGSEQVVYFK